MNVAGMIYGASSALLALGIIGVIAGMGQAAFEDRWPWWGTASALALVVAAGGMGLVS